MQSSKGLSSGSKGDIDYTVFLDSVFDPREYAQSLLNGSSSFTGSKSSHADGDGPVTLDKRSLIALQQLGLLSPGQLALTSASTGGDSDPAQAGKADKVVGNAHPSGGPTTSAHDAFTSAFAKAGSGDVSTALSRLSFAVDDLNKQLRGEINTHHSALLVQAGSVSSLEDNLRQVRSGLDEVESSVDRLRRKIAQPYITLSTSLEKLAKLQRASDLARRAARFITLARRLEVQMAELNAANSKAKQLQTNGDSSNMAGAASTAQAKDFDGGERVLGEAALTLAELDVLLEDSPSATSLRTVTAIEAHIPAVESNRVRVINEMEVMIRRGLQELNQSLLASSLQTAYNLSVLPHLVASLVQDLIDAIESRIKNAFDVNLLAKDALNRAGEPVQPLGPASSVFYKSRARTEPTSATLPHFQAALWARLEGLIEDMAGCCIKVHVLERVLKLKRDSVAQRTFLDDALSVLDNKPTFTFWTTLSQAFEAQARDAGRASPFVQQALSVAYPRLLRLFHEFFAKIALQSDTVYTPQHQSPETVLILRSISSFENLYLNRCLNRMNENVAHAFSGGSKNPPGNQDGLTAARVISNELDAARFDPLLVKNVAKNVGKAIDMFVDRADALIATDYTATSMAGPMATSSQQSNIELANALHHFWSPLSKVILSYPQSVQDQLKPNIANARQILLSITTPVFSAIRRELASIIARIHKTGFNKPMDPTSTSAYMQDLSDRIAFLRRQIFAGLRIGETMRDWVVEVCKFIIGRFVLHASIVQPLGEGGKLKLTTDCTTLEFAVSQVLSDYKLNLPSLGDDFRSLRAFRPLLFLETTSLNDATRTKDVPDQILLHHILVRSNGAIPLPHQLHGWQEVEYCKYVAEHSAADNMRLIEAALKDWEDKQDTDVEASEQGDTARECARLAREVIDKAKEAA